MKWSGQRLLPTMAVAAGISLVSLALRREAVAVPPRRRTPAPVAPPTIGIPHRERSRLRSIGAAVGLFVTAATVALVLLPRDVHMFHPSWLLHPDETGYLVTSKHLADTGSFVIEDPWYAQDPTHVPAGSTLAEGRIVPQKAVGGYIAYAAAFMVSDGAWRLVGPLFGLLAAAAVALLVLRKTRSLIASSAAGVVAATASPIIMWASGLAFSDIIAVAAFLWAAWFVASFSAKPSSWAGIGAGACIGAAMLVRYDFALAALLAVAVAGMAAHRRGEIAHAVLRALPGAALFSTAAVIILVANSSFYGSPFTTGYASGWQESPGGVAGSFLAVEPLRFPELATDYLVRIGLPCTLLLLGGIVWKLNRRSFDAADGFLLGFAAFSVVYYLGRPGAYGTGDSWLISSYPRYILPVYLAGVVVGFEAIAGVLSRVTPSSMLKASVILSVAAIAAVVSLREAYTNERGVGYVERITSAHRSIDEVATDTVQPVVVVSDLNSKAVPGAYTITPHLVPPSERDVAADIRRQLEDGKHVLVIGDQRDHPLYTGYIEELDDAGLVLVPRRCSVEVYEAFLPQDAPNLVESC